MEPGACPACLYALAASIAYPALSRVLRGKLSSERGFLLAYYVAIYAPLALEGYRTAFWPGLAAALLALAAVPAALAGSGERALRSRRSYALALAGFATSLTTILMS